MLISVYVGVGVMNYCGMQIGGESATLYRTMHSPFYLLTYHKNHIILGRTTRRYIFT